MNFETVQQELAATDDAMRRDFERNVGTWVTARDAAKAEGVVSARKLVPMKPKPAAK